MSFSASLKQELQIIRSLTQPTILERSAFLKQLVFTYHVIKCSENLLRVAIAQAEEGSSLHSYLVEHAEEEQGHAEWLAADLATAGIDVKKTVAPREATQMTGCMYTALFHSDVHAMLGYMAVLEFFPTPLELVDTLERAFGKDLVRTLRYHAEHDIDHGSDLEEVIDALPKDKQLVVFAAAVDTALYQQSAARNFN